MPPLSVRLLSSSPADRAAVQRVLDDAPAYFRVSSGAPARTDEADRLFRELPPGRTLDDKRVFGVFLDDDMVGCADVLLRWPSDRVAMIGLLVIREAHQRRGIGSAAFRLLERALVELGFERTRIAVIHDHASALAFWRGLGFVETGERKPWAEGSVRTEVIVFEKDS